MYRSVSTYKTPVARKLGGAGGSINTSESIYPGGQIRERGGGGGGGGGRGREVRQVPLAFIGPNTKSETPSGLMYFYKYHN